MSRVNLTEARIKASPGFESFWKVMLAFNVVVVIAFAFLFGWIIKRLTSPEIRGEFTNTANIGRVGLNFRW